MKRKYAMEVGDIYKANKGNFKVKIIVCELITTVITPLIVEALNSVNDIIKGEHIEFTSIENFKKRYTKV